jgi:hypothetical protein
MTHMGKGGETDEAGATLILALIFAVVTALIVAALAAWTSNDLKNIANLKSSRSMLSAADGATQAAMGGIRYVYWTSGSCGGPFTINNWDFTVTCTLSSIDEGSINSRVVIVNTFLSGNPKAVLQAQVTFNDFASPPSDKNDCNTAPTPTTCGTGMTVNSWVVQPT